MTTIKTGILSFGMSGKIFHAPFLHQHSGFDLAAVVERTEKKAHSIYPNIKSYHTVDELLTDTTIELVVVNTPNSTHYEFALQALKAKKHVLVEKPFAITSSEAKELFQEATHNGCFILPYQNRRYDSEFQSVKKIVDAEKLGQLVEVHFRFDRYRYSIGPKKAKESPIPGGGLMYDLGPHVLDQAISLFGIPLKWGKSTGYHRPLTQVDDYAHFHLYYPKGLQVFITMSLLVADPQPAYILHGTKGSFVKHRTDIQETQLVDGMLPDDPLYGVESKEQPGTLTTVLNETEKNRESIKPEKASYMHVFDDVFKTIRKGKAYPVTQQQILKQLEILEY